MSLITEGLFERAGISSPIPCLRSYLIHEPLEQGDFIGMGDYLAQEFGHWNPKRHLNLPMIIIRLSKGLFAATVVF